MGAPTPTFLCSIREAGLILGRLLGLILLVGVGGVGATGRLLDGVVDLVGVGGAVFLEGLEKANEFSVHVANVQEGGCASGALVERVCGVEKPHRPAPR